MCWFWLIELSKSDLHWESWTIPSTNWTLMRECTFIIVRMIKKMRQTKIIIIIMLLNCWMLMQHPNVKWMQLSIGILKKKKKNNNNKQKQTTTTKDQTKTSECCNITWAANNEVWSLFMIFSITNLDNRMISKTNNVVDHTQLRLFVLISEAHRHANLIGKIKMKYKINQIL